MNNMKNVMVALSAAMLATVAAPLAAADDPENCSALFAPMAPDGSGGFITAGALSEDVREDHRLISGLAIAQGTYTVEVDPAANFEVTVWTLDGGECNRADTNGSLIVPEDNTKDYYLLVVFDGEDADSYTATLTPQA